ncbi:hypothetical protein N8K70_10465 [Microbacterium betulae]|uniref:Uncharacterized protein n=1 Tax=Microbacterium betulae TaxID=2981139 RepID=A0AA97I586_9MICO|nr:hypothetical protein [Microbacterium sp. AB]WOF21807.1 hypothetical protein N8K70_10465 [Microbacterium sp. AB]
MIRLLTAFVLGAGAAAVLFGILIDDRYTWVWITAIVVISLLLPLILVARTFGPLARATPQRIQEAIDAGRLGAARIDALRRTGTTINDQPLCEIDLSVSAGDRAAYRTTIKQIVDIVDIPRRQPGSAVAVVRVEAASPDVVIVDRPLSDLDARVSSLPARERLPEWRDDPKAAEKHGRRDGPLIGIGAEGRGWRFLAYAGLFAAGAAAVLLPASDEVERRALDLVTGEDHSSMFAPGRLEEALAAIEEASGTDESVDITVYTDFVSAEMATAPGASTFDTYSYRRGAATNDGPSIIQPTDPELEVFRLDDVAWDRAPRMLDESYERTDVVPDSEHAPYLVVRRWPVAGEAYPVTLAIYLPGDYDTSSVEFAADGSFVEVR